MMTVLAVLVLAVLCILAAPTVLRLFLRLLAFAVCLLVSLLLRQFVSEAIQVLFPIPPLGAEVLAIILLYFALRSVMAMGLHRLISSPPRRARDVIGLDLLLSALPASFIVAGVGGLFLPGTQAWHGVGLLIAIMAALLIAALDVVFPSALGNLAECLWGRPDCLRHERRMK